MDFDERLSSYRESNPDIKQLTLRISKEHARKLKKLAKEKKIKEGVYLRLLVEFAIDESTGHADPKEKKAGDKIKIVPFDRFNDLQERVKDNSLQILSLKQQIDTLNKQLDHLRLK